MLFRSVAGALSLLSFAHHSAAAQFQEVANFTGPNPTKARMFIYVPDKLAQKPAILAAPHWCHGTAQAVHTGSQWAANADKYGFIVIYPQAPSQGTDQCWDVSSQQSLTHNGGGDSQGIVSMIRWALDNYNGDPDRVFVTGVSSGAMMTNVLLSSYPDVFAAGSAWAGVAAFCFAGNGFDVWSDDCAKGKVIKTGAEWAQLVQNAYPGYNGYRPKMQIAHGNADQVLDPQNFQEEIKEWTAVLGLNSSQPVVTANNPLANWTRYNYGPKFEAYKVEGVTHDIKVQWDLVISWFDLSCTSGACFSRKSAPQRLLRYGAWQQDGIVRH